MRLNQFGLSPVTCLGIALHLICYVEVVLGHYFIGFCVSPLPADNSTKKWFNRAVVAPSILIVMLILLPACLFAFFILWMLHLAVKPSKFLRIEFDRKRGRRCEASSYSFVSANVLVGPEMFGNLQGIRHNLWRFLTMVWRLSRGAADAAQSEADNCPLLEDSSVGIDEKQRSLLMSDWPSGVDVVCFQEVWDLASALSIVAAFRSRSSLYTDFVVHPTEATWSSNYVAFGSSGLFVASRHRILEVQYSPFREHAPYFQKLCNYAVLSMKLETQPQDPSSGRSVVGFVSNHHFPYFIDDQSVVMEDVDFLLKCHREFEDRHTNPAREEVAFSVICGDFNVGNTEKGEMPCHSHPLYTEHFTDYAMEKPGEDKPWVMTTMLDGVHWEAWGRFSPEQLREKMLIRSERRKLAWKNEKEELRYDKIVFDHRKTYSKPNSFHYLTTLSGCSDHLPLMLKLGKR